MRYVLTIIFRVHYNGVWIGLLDNATGVCHNTSCDLIGCICVWRWVWSDGSSPDLFRAWADAEPLAIMRCAYLKTWGGDVTWGGENRCAENETFGGRPFFCKRGTVLWILLFLLCRCCCVRFFFCKNTFSSISFTSYRIWRKYKAIRSEI